MAAAAATGGRRPRTTMLLAFASSTLAVVDTQISQPAAGVQARPAPLRSASGVLPRSTRHTGALSAGAKPGGTGAAPQSSVTTPDGAHTLKLPGQMTAAGTTTTPAAALPNSNKSNSAPHSRGIAAPEAPGCRGGIDARAQMCARVQNFLRRSVARLGDAGGDGGTAARRDGRRASPGPSSTAPAPVRGASSSLFHAGSPGPTFKHSTARLATPTRQCLARASSSWPAAAAPPPPRGRRAPQTRRRPRARLRP